MTHAVLAPLGYEDGFRRGLEWASHAPEREVRELVECTRGRRWTAIPVRPDWTSLRAVLDGRGLVGDGGAAARVPFLEGFVESASFLWWDPESVDDGFDT